MVTRYNVFYFQMEKSGRSHRNWPLSPEIRTLYQLKIRTTPIWCLPCWYRVVRFSLLPRKKSPTKCSALHETGKDAASSQPTLQSETMGFTTQSKLAFCVSVSEITLVRGAGKGVIAIKMDAEIPLKDLN